MLPSQTSLVASNFGGEIGASSIGSMATPRPTMAISEPSVGAACAM
jgi:hypothetical protein